MTVTRPGNSKSRGVTHPPLHGSKIRYAEEYPHFRTSMKTVTALLFSALPLIQANRLEAKFDADTSGGASGSVVFEYTNTENPK